MLKPKMLEAEQLSQRRTGLGLSVPVDGRRFESKNFRGMARWMRTQSHEEWGHGMKIYDFIVSRSGRIRWRP